MAVPDSQVPTFSNKHSALAAVKVLLQFAASTVRDAGSQAEDAGLQDVAAQVKSLAPGIDAMIANIEQCLTGKQ